MSSCIGPLMPCALSVQVRLYLVISLFEYRFSLLFSRDFSGFYLFAQVEFENSFLLMKSESFLALAVGLKNIFMADF